MAKQHELKTLNGKLVLQGSTISICVEGKLPLLISLTPAQKYRLVRSLRNVPIDDKPVRLGSHDHIQVLKHTTLPHLQFVDLHTKQAYTVKMDGTQKMIFVNYIDWHTGFWGEVL